MHCRNVKLAAGPPPPAKLEKARLRRGHKPSIRYHVLEIEPLRARGRQADGLTVRGGEPLNALHLCRGHFKDYGEGNGLFGRYHGKWWWPGQARGSFKKGIVAKDYRMGRVDPEPQDPSHPRQDGSHPASAAVASEPSDASGGSGSQGRP
jgi:hypothetical protein